MSIRGRITAISEQRRDARRWRAARELYAVAEKGHPFLYSDLGSSGLAPSHRIVPERARTANERARLASEEPHLARLLATFIEYAAAVPESLGYVQMERSRTHGFLGLSQWQAVVEGRDGYWWMYTFTLAPELADAPEPVVRYLAAFWGTESSTISTGRHWPSRSGMSAIRRILADQGALPLPARVPYSSTKPHYGWVYHAAVQDRACRLLTGVRLDAEIAGWLDAADARELVPTWRARLAIQEADDRIWPEP